ncbi:hypothetical protein Csa_014076, partial [Cucumis sativus]
ADKFHSCFDCLSCSSFLIRELHGPTPPSMMDSINTPSSTQIETEPTTNQEIQLDPNRYQ